MSGIKACAPQPVTSIQAQSEVVEAAGPVATLISPTGPFMTCRPTIAETPFVTPARTSSIAPPGAFSSACWKMSFTLPGSRLRSRMRMAAAPRSIAMCPSCPQACETPGFSDAKGRPVVSGTGRASMSARIATVRIIATRLVNSAPASDYMIQTRPTLKKNVERLNVIEKPVPMAMVVPKGSEALQQRLNKAFADIHADGTYGRIHEKWFGRPAD